MQNRGLFIGINNYPGTRLDLSGCVNDAKDWGKLIEPRCSESAYLLDAQATHQNIIEHVKRMLSLLRPGDWGFVTFSGHGSWVPDESGDEPDGRDECLIPHDFNNPIMDDNIHELLMERVQGSNLLLIADSCHSGTVYRMFNPPGDYDRKIRFMSPAVFLPENRSRQAELTAGRLRAIKQRIAPGLVLLAGCADVEYCYDAQFNGRGNGAFTRAAIDSLVGMRKASNFNTWYRRIRTMLPSYQYPQSPKLNARDTEAGLALPFVG